MQPERFIRLMSIISDVKYNPHSNPDELCARFNISHRQFYKDRDSLMQMGYEFRFSRRRQRLLLEKEPEGNITPDGFTALLLSTQSALSNNNNLSLFLNRLASLRFLLQLLPASLQKVLGNAINQLLFHDGIKCGPIMLDALITCITEGRRMIALLKNMEAQIMLDPQKLILQNGVLYVISDTLPMSHPFTTLLPTCENYESMCSSLSLGLAVEHIRKVLPTPFFAPRATPN